MKKHIALLFAVIFCIALIKGQTPLITMTTAISVDSTFSFLLGATNPKIKVDFGDGTLLNFNVDTLYTWITGKLVKSQTVNIYGTGITYLECGGREITSLDVSKDTTLTTLYCSDTTLTSLDLSRNIALKVLSCSMCRLASLDVSNNIALTELRCDVNQLTSLDVSKNTALTFLSCELNQLTSLDVSNNIALAYLGCGVNQLSSLDVTKNIALWRLDCFNNQLTALDVSKNKALWELYCRYNELTFATLPIDSQYLWDYWYAPQYPISIAKSISPGTELDLSSQLTANGDTTVYTWRKQSGANLIDGTDYTIIDGKTTFLKAQTDSVYCEMTNATFPDFYYENVLKTTLTKVTTSNSIDDFETKAIDIYSHCRTLYINSPYNAQLLIYDVNGRLILNRPINSGISNIQLQGTGIYLVKLTGKIGLVTRKIFIE